MIFQFPTVDGSRMLSYKTVLYIETVSTWNIYHQATFAGQLWFQIRSTSNQLLNFLKVLYFDWHFEKNL